MTIIIFQLISSYPWEIHHHQTFIHQTFIHQTFIHQTFIHPLAPDAYLILFALSLSMMLHYIIVLVFLCENVKTTNILIFLWEYKFCMCQIDQMSFNTWMPCHVIAYIIPFHDAKCHYSHGFIQHLFFLFLFPFSSFTNCIHCSFERISLILWWCIPYHTIPYHIIPYYTIPYYTILYHIILYHAILICCSYIQNDIKLICCC